MTQEVIDRLQLEFSNLTGRYTLTQFAILIAIFIVAHFLAKKTRPRMNRWLAKRSNFPLWMRQFFFALIKHSRLIYFFIFTVITRLVMLEIYRFASRSYFIKVAATVAGAMILVMVVSRLIRNKLLRRSFKWIAWISAFLYITGYLDETVTLLNSLAIDIGDFHMSLYTILTAVFYLIFFVSIARIVQVFLVSQIGAIDDITPSQRVLGEKIVSFILFALAVIIGMRMVGLDLSKFALLSGAIGVGIGFGLQKVVSNLVSGVILLLDRSIKPGDVISIGQTFGWITHLGSRYVSVNTRDGKTFLIPNEDLITGQVVNWTHSSEAVRLDIYFGCSYNNDPHEVRRLCIKAAESVDRVISNPKPVCHIVGYGDNSVDYILRFWIKDPTGGLTNVRGNVFLAVWDILKENNIEIPFPQRDVRILSVPDASKDGGSPVDEAAAGVID